MSDATARLPAPGSRLPASVHLVGIGGMHMSAIAQILLAGGTRVSGSDQSRSAMTEKLRALGADVRYGHAAEHVGDVDLVVQTAAAKEDNPELQEARRRGIPVISRAAMVARLMEGRTGICVAGTHGKTTTSSMIAWVLRQAGRDPSFLLGGESLDLGTNAHAGTGTEIVVEADEYARAFLEYRPKLAVITNVEADHLEYYGSTEAYEEAFRQFMGRVQPDGVIIACAVSPRLAALASERQEAPVEFYAFLSSDAAGATARWQATGARHSEGGTDFEVLKDRELIGRFSLAIPGEHMASNALAAVACGMHLGIESAVIATALASFRGARRRFEHIGAARGIDVIDDFAHHPTEVRVNLAAARDRYPGRRIVLVFQPHTYSRTAYLLDEFADCFAASDRLLILETFASRETPAAGMSAQQLASEVKSPPSEYVATVEDAADRLLTELRSGDVLVTMGAGDVDRVGRAVIEGLRST